MRVAGTSALVTGASSGIGRSLAVELAARGAGKIALVARRAEALAETAALVTAQGARALVLAADVGDKGQIEASVKQAESEFGGIDLVIANAGIADGSRRPKAEDVERVMRVNFLGAVYPMLAALDGMKERKRGHLVGISSLAALRGLSSNPAYSASKAALDTFLEGLRVSLKRSRVGVTVVRPGYVDTPLNQMLRSRPFLVTADDAARRIVTAIESNRRDLDFPLPTAAAMRALRTLPDFVYDLVAPKL